MKKALISEEVFELSLKEITYSLSITPDLILEIVDEGIIHPGVNHDNEWVFDSEAYRRIHTAIRLHQDLGINFAGAALILELLDEIQQLRLK